MHSQNKHSQQKKMRLTLPKFHPRALFLLIPLFLSLIMSGVVSLVTTIKGQGFHPEVISPWLSAWLISWLIAFPTVLLVLPIARKTAMLFIQAEVRAESNGDIS